jgi:hypothetical protein
MMLRWAIKTRSRVRLRARYKLVNVAILVYAKWPAMIEEDINKLSKRPTADHIDDHSDRDSNVCRKRALQKPFNEEEESFPSA